MISVVLPVFNEEDNVQPVYARVTEQLVALHEPYEIIFVDDGSGDGTVERLRAVCRRDPCIKLVSLSRNFGHQVAITAGLEYASGDAVIVMDADLQHPPELIPTLVARWKEGFDVVYTVRGGREHAGAVKRAGASLFYRLINRMCDLQITENAPDFRLMDRRVVDALRLMPERARFLRGLVKWVGFRQLAIPFVAAPRTWGRTKYPFRKMLRFSVDGVTAFSSFPLRLASYLGLIAAFSGVPYALWAVYTRVIIGTAVPGWASLVVAVLFLGGVQLIAIGIMGEYLGRVYEEVKGRPLFLTRELVGKFGTERIPDRSAIWMEAGRREEAAALLAAPPRPWRSGRARGF